MLEVAVGHEFVGVGDGEVAFPIGEGRLLLWRAHVGKDQAAAFEGLVRSLADRATVALTLFFFAFWEGHAQAGAVHIELHAVVAAGNAVLFNFSVFQRGAAVHAVGMQQADAAAPVAEAHQFLAQDLQKTRRVGQLHGHAHRVPEAAQVFAGRRTWAYLGEFGIVSRHRVGEVAAIGDQPFIDRCFGDAVLVSSVHAAGPAGWAGSV